MSGLSEDRYWDQVQARREAEKPPYCEKCGTSLRGCYAYDTPEGLCCESCADDLLIQYKLDWECDADDYR